MTPAYSKGEFMRELVLLCERFGVALPVVVIDWNGTSHGWKRTADWLEKMHKKGLRR